MNSAGLKLALRILARRKFLTSISLFGIVLTLVVLTVGATLLDNCFAPREPEGQFDRVLCVYVIGRYGPEASQTMTPGYYFLDRYLRTLPDVERITIFSTVQSTAIYRDGARVDTMMKRTDGAYWQILRFRFLEGRAFTADEDQRGAQVAVISEALRTKLFDAAPAVGRTLDVDGQTFRIIGVVPKVPFTRVAAYSEIWLPIGTIRSDAYRREWVGEFSGIVLARSRSDFPRLKREFAARVDAIKPPDRMFDSIRAGLDTPFEAAARLAVGSPRDRATATFRAVFIVGALLFMTLPALNLVTLSLSRILERASEIGVRKAFGAPRGALVRQLLTENVILTVIGGVIAFVIAAILIPLLNDIGTIPGAQLELNVRIFAYGMLLAVVFGILSGFYPAWRMARIHPVEALRGGAL